MTSGNHARFPDVNTGYIAVSQKLKNKLGEEIFTRIFLKYQHTPFKIRNKSPSLRMFKLNLLERQRDDLSSSKRHKKIWKNLSKKERESGETLTWKDATDCPEPAPEQPAHDRRV